ncbi:MAG: ribonuclease H-like domain-containing protein [Candidatus Adlerbacteria bacterium]
MRIITFDIETTGSTVGGAFDFASQELTICCVHDSETGEYSSYLKEELPKMWGLFERADILVGYNSDHFDIPILNKYYSGDLTKIKSIDLLKEVRAVLGRRLKMDNIAEATLGRNKTASGMQAVTWWAEGKVDLVRQYCIEDVKITKELYDYAKKHKSLKYKDFDGPREIKLDPSGWEKLTEVAALNHTLPF